MAFFEVREASTTVYLSFHGSVVSGLGKRSHRFGMPIAELNGKGTWSLIEAVRMSHKWGPQPSAPSRHMAQGKGRSFQT